MEQVSTSAQVPVDLLILGAGWTSQFLIPFLHSAKVSFAATTTNGRTLDDEYHTPTIPFTFDPSSDSEEPYSALPRAKVVLITFPLKGQGQVGRLVGGYTKTHSSSSSGDCDTGGVEKKDGEKDAVDIFRWIQFGSTGIWSAGNSNNHNSRWVDRKSEYDVQNARAIAEDELLELGETSSTSAVSTTAVVGGGGYHCIHESMILNLAGLHGGARNPSNWISRVVKSKDDLKEKGALHLVHGEDIALAVVELTKSISTSTSASTGTTWDRMKNQRWLLTDLHIYDWWEIVVSFKKKKKDGELDEGKESKEAEEVQWVQELMRCENVRALPRGAEILGRCLDSREFWEILGIWPRKSGWKEIR